MLRAYAVRFDVTENLEFFFGFWCELNIPFRSLKIIIGCFGHVEEERSFLCVLIPETKILKKISETTATVTVVP